MKLIDCSEIVFWFLCVCVCVLVVVVPSSSSTSPSKKWNGKIKSWTKPAFWCSRSKGQQFNSLFLLFFLLLLHVTLIYFPRESFTGRGREQRRNLTIYQLSGGTQAHSIEYILHTEKRKRKNEPRLLEASFRIREGNMNKIERKKWNEKKMEAGNRSYMLQHLLLFFTSPKRGRDCVLICRHHRAAAMLLLFHLSAFVTPIYKTRVEFQIIFF